MMGYMCRLLAFSFNKDTCKKEKVACIDSFRMLSATGSVLPMSTPGHADGWGFSLYQDEVVMPRFYKSTLPAREDSNCKIESFFENGIRESGLVHLRKMTIGGADIVNTHPFIEDEYSFIHNGTISQTEKLYEDLSIDCKGSTDSERLFRRFLEIKKNKTISTKEAFIKMLTETKDLYPGYSAINTILHDGDSIYVSRVINQRSQKYTFSDTESYYTLYAGVTKRGDNIVSSEKILYEDISYTLLPNDSISIITLSNGLLETYQLV